MWIPAVLITAHGSEDLAVQALRAGARDYLKKPIPVGEFRRVVIGHTRHADHSDLHLLPPDATGATHQGLRRALLFLREHFSEPLTLSQVALEASLSRFHLCRLFRQQVGRSFREYLQEIRIHRAKALLTDGQMTVTEIAYATGFNDLSHFDKVFNRVVGVSPRRYRRAIRPA